MAVLKQQSIFDLKGIDVKYTLDNGITALKYVLYAECAHLCEKMLKLGANPNAMIMMKINILCHYEKL